jgi:trigger factor
LKVTVERTPESEAKLHVELDWPEIESASDKAYKRMAQKYNVPGFRRGHAPRTMLERMLGKEAIYQEGLDDLIDNAYRNAIVENNLTPLTQPHVDTEQTFEIGQPFNATVHVPVLTPATLGDYKAIRVPLPDMDTTEEQVEETVERLRQQQAAWMPADRPAKVGDQVTVDLKLDSGDRNISNLHDNEFVLSDERAGIFSGMDEHIVGMREGETKSFTTTIPEDYGNPEFAGKEASYDVTMKAVKEHELPELNDEFAMSIGEYSTMVEVRAAIREQLKTQRQRDANRELGDAVVKALTDSTTYNIHPLLVKDEVETMDRETRRMLEDSRLTLEQFLDATKKSEEAYREEMEPEATERVKRDLGLAALADAEQVTVDDDEGAQWYEMMTALTTGRRERWRDLTASQKRSVIARLRRDKALDRMVEIATEGKWPPAAESDEASAASVTSAASAADEADEATQDARTQANAAAAARVATQTAEQAAEQATEQVNATASAAASAVSEEAPVQSGAPDAAGAKGKAADMPTDKATEKAAGKASSKAADTAQTEE